MEHPKLRLTIPWISLELPAQEQICRILELNELVALAIMPDAHYGYDLCIGGVALTTGVISPSFVGYDIGCGMCHVNTSLSVRELGLEKQKDREKLFKKLAGVVPSGVGGTNDVGTDFIFRSASGNSDLDKQVRPNVIKQMCTLGSGNHFLEIGENSSHIIGVTVHSGSRRVGYDIAAWYMAQGRLLPLDSDLGQAYLSDMLWAQDFALENRRLMLKEALYLLGFSDDDIESFFAPTVLINESHNHAVPYADGLMLHRKGATAAEEGQMGVISSNQRDGVWITRGLGNKEFLSSASHGAGRVMSRKAASKKGSVSDLEKLMRGIVCRTDKEILDEAPWAYKKIEPVLAAQDGLLVDVLDHFKPIIVLKG
ncbi:MAG: RtcB family protein [Deltaproteobacteria bacterium]|jgi:tRNA-splicing ligase RtcB|nr:RtcB family protein [Deltaproteobacteria bacterium]